MRRVDRLSLTALAAVNGVGSQTILDIFKYLNKHEVAWEEFWVLNDTLVKLMRLSEKQINSIKLFKKEHTIYSYGEYLHERGISVLIKGQAGYPDLLDKCLYSPVVLFVKGAEVMWDERPVVAVVGARSITAYGRLVTNKIVSELVVLGSTIVSGFMYGVDVLAHTACLEAHGKTVGVLGYGFDFCYPSNQEQLFKEMLEKGATFYSPFAPHVPPKKGHFPARNRVVAGMSHAVVVTEAAEKSGSHITAGYALDEGRVVCAVPGPITNPYSEGTRSLLNQGAVLVQSGWDVFQECGYYLNGSELSRDEASPVPGIAGQIVGTLQSGAFSTDELLGMLKLQYTSLITQLTILELEGKIAKQGDRWHITT